MSPAPRNGWMEVYGIVELASWVLAIDDRAGVIKREVMRQELAAEFECVRADTEALLQASGLRTAPPEP
jgi:hypothetical protein